MIHIFLVIVQIILLIVLFFIIIFFVLWSIGNIKNRVPFVTASMAVLKDIAKALDVKDESVVYDLGCGDGRVLLFLSRICPKAKYIGIENNIFPLILAKTESFFNYKKRGIKVDILNKNFFKQDLRDATHIFIYLYPDIMDELLPKFEKELKSGTRLVSLSFKFTTKTPMKEIDLGRSKYKLGRKLYIYEF